MLLTTPTEFALVALVLIAGWLFGLASHSGGAKWKARYLAERDAHAAYRRDADARVSAADARHAELERDHARLRDAAPVTAQTVAPVSAAPVSPAPISPAPVARPAATPAYATSTIAPQSSTVIRPTRAPGEKRGWFDFGPR